MNLVIITDADYDPNNDLGEHPCLIHITLQRYRAQNRTVDKIAAKAIHPPLKLRKKRYGSSQLDGFETEHHTRQPLYVCYISILGNHGIFDQQSRNAK